MRQARVGMLATLMVLLCVFSQAQQSVATATDATVPPLVNFSGVLIGLNGKPLSGVVGVTFYLYKEQQGGAPLWLETQNVQPNSTGHYTVMLGSTTSQGIPANIFASGEAHWLGVQVQGQAEQPRVLLVSAPYALKAGDAETLGGLPASAFALAIPQSKAASANTVASVIGQSTPPPASAVTGTGTANYLPLWDSASDIVTSVLFQKGLGSTAKIGINTSSPSATLDVKGGTLLSGKSTTAFGLTVSSPVQLGEEIQGPLTGIGAGLDFLTTGTGGKQWEILATGNTASQGAGKLNIRDVASSTDVLTIDASDTVNVNTNLNVAGGAITFTGNQSVNGNVIAGTSSSSSFGVLGEANAGSGQTYGVGGYAASPAGYGVEGLNLAAGGIGVYGFDSAGTGVFGSGATYGVRGTATAASSTGVYGTSTGGGSTVGVYGSGANGVQGRGTANGVYGTGDNGVQGLGTYNGVYGTGTTNGVYGTGLYGVSGNGTADGVLGTGPNGVYGTGTTNGVYGTGPVGVYGSGTTEGVYGIGAGAPSGSGLNGGNGISASGGIGDPSSSTAYGGAGGIFDGGASGNGYGNGYGGVGIEGLGGEGGPYSGGNGGDGISASGGNGFYSGYAGYFSGNIDVTGSTQASSDELKIDHPLDPANKYLYHSSVESSEMMNIYTGNVTTDSQGLATVQLPDWFEAVNTDFRYQLTVIGQFAQAIVGSKVASHQFGIRTDKPNVEVSWQITGVRQDAYAKAHPLVVEQAKNARERAHYIHPELYGAPEEQSIDWARHPHMMKQMQEMQARQLATIRTAGQPTTARSK